MPITRITGIRTFAAGDVTKDTLLGSASVTRSNSSGDSAQEFYEVEGLDGSSALQRLLTATLAPGIPRLGSPHPLLRVPVESVRATFIERNFVTQAIVEVNYGLPQGGGGFSNNPDDSNAQPQLEIISTKQPVLKAFDVNGVRLSLPTYLKTTSAEGVTPVVRTVQPEQGGEVEVIEDQTIVIARRRERSSPGIGITRTHNNTVNDTSVFGDLPDMWHVNISGTTDDGGDTWNVVYEFQRNWPDSWNTVFVYRDPETGLPAAEITPPPEPTVPGSEGNGTKVARSYFQSNFRLLQLPIFD